MKIALLIATALLIGAPAAMAQTKAPQTTTRKEATATATTTVTPNGQKTITQSNRVATTTTAPAAASVPPAKPAAVPAPKAQPAPAKPKRATRVLHHWEPFDIGNQNPRELAAKIRASLAIDSTGNLVIDTKNCKPSNGYSCGTPQHYLEVAQKANDRANIKTYGDLLAMLDRLIMTEPPKGEYWMACLQKQPDGKVIVIWNCMSREFERLPDGASESAWMDPLTGKVVFAQHCTNGVGARVDDCDEQHIWLHAGDELHGTVAGPDAIPDDACRPAIKRAGAKEWSNAILDKCPRSNCDYSDDLAEARRRYPETEWKLQNFRISFEAPVTGEYVVRVSRFFEHSKDIFWYCDVFPDGTQTNAIAFTSTSYQSFGWAYADFGGAEALSAEARAKKNWRGTVHVWQRSDERAFKGSRPPVGASTK